MGKSIDVKKFLLHNLVLLGIVVLCVVTAIVEPLFLTQNNFTNILRQFGPLSFVALGMTYVIIGRDDIAGLHKIHDHMEISSGMLSEAVHQLNDSARLCCRNVNPALHIISLIKGFKTYFM